MKIAIFHELHNGGARRAANEFAQCLKKNHTVDLYIVDNEKNEKDSSFYTSVKLYTFIQKKWKGNNWKIRLYKDTVELYKIKKLHKKIAGDINEKNYDVVLVFPSRFTQAPFILNFLHPKSVYFAMEPLRIVYDPTLQIPKSLDTPRYLYEKLNRINRKIIDKQNINKADTIIAPSKFSAAFSSRVYKKNVTVAYLGLNTNFFTDTHAKREIDVLFIGSQDLFDGYIFFKQVLNNLHNKITVREVLFENEWLQDTQIRDLYRSTKILVATSYNELLGMIPLEAMGCGVVVLAVDEAGYKETIKNHINGYLITRDEKLFAKKIEYLMDNKPIMKLLSKNASQKIQKFWNWEERTKELERILKK